MHRCWPTRVLAGIAVFSVGKTEGEGESAQRPPAGEKKPTQLMEVDAEHGFVQKLLSLCP